MTNKKLSRRRVLRGMMQGTAVGVGLPLLDVFLDDNGSAFASGEQLPSCFGTWFWGLGLGSTNWAPEKTGKDYELTAFLKEFEPIRDKINIYSGMHAFADGGPTNHGPAAQVLMTGASPGHSSDYRQSVDAIIAKKLGMRTRFPSLEVNCSGDEGMSFSARSDNAVNPPELSPTTLYQRIFGAGFVDPNAAEFTPDPGVMLRKSALSAVKDERQKLMQVVGANDRDRLDEFFTSLRGLEQKLALELERPAPMPSCEVPDGTGQRKKGYLIDNILHNHELFIDLIAHALSCGQTRIFNMSIGLNGIRELGDPSHHHLYTHEEQVDPELGYQPITYWFAMRYMRAFRDLVRKLDSIREGDGTLLDRTLVLAYTDHGDAMLHLMDWLPIFTAGGANGGMKTGMHVAAEGDPCTRVTLTCQQAMGLPVRNWGAGANTVDKGFTEVLS